MSVQICGAGVREIWFAGGCFWGVEEYFSRIPGVLDAVSGYANGTTENPGYEDVCSGKTGHAETVLVRYAPKIVSLKILATQFFTIIDPYSLNRQGNDRGTQYRSGMYYTNPADREILASVMAAAQARLARLVGKSVRPFVVELLPLANFYPAEEYHQDYLKKHPGGYCHINFDSLRELPPLPPSHEPTPGWQGHGAGPLPEAELKKRLSPQAFAVTQKAATERPFTGQYWNHFAPGIYVDIVSGEPLFASTDKFDSACGWPSFAKPIAGEALTEHRDQSHGMVRIEVKSRESRSHLGHVFPDGPKKRGGLRYCINSAALRFVPLADMEKEGYGQYISLIQGEP